MVIRLHTNEEGCNCVRIEKIERLLRVFCIDQTMKNIYNLVSDAFVAALLDESGFETRIVRETPNLCVVTIKKNQTGEVLRVDVVHEPDGYIQNVRSSFNTLFPDHGFSYSTFLNTIYNEEFVSF